MTPQQAPPPPPPPPPPPVTTATAEPSLGASASQTAEGNAPPRMIFGLEPEPASPRRGSRRQAGKSSPRKDTRQSSQLSFSGPTSEQARQKKRPSPPADEGPLNSGISTWPNSSAVDNSNTSTPSLAAHRQPTSLPGDLEQRLQSIGLSAPATPSNPVSRGMGAFPGSAAPLTSSLGLSVNLEHKLRSMGGAATTATAGAMPPPPPPLPPPPATTISLGSKSGRLEAKGDEPEANGMGTPARPVQGGAMSRLELKLQSLSIVQKPPPPPVPPPPSSTPGLFTSPNVPKLGLGHLAPTSPAPSYTPSLQQTLSPRESDGSIVFEDGLLLEPEELGGGSDSGRRRSELERLRAENRKLLGEKRVLQMRLSAATGSTPSDRQPAIPEDDDRESGAGRGRLQHHLDNLKDDLDTIADKYMERFQVAAFMSPASSVTGRNEDSDTASLAPSLTTSSVAHPSADTPSAPLSPTTSAADSSQNGGCGTTASKRVQVQVGEHEWEFASSTGPSPSSVRSGAGRQTPKRRASARGVFTRLQMAKQSPRSAGRRGVGSSRF